MKKVLLFAAMSLAAVPAFARFDERHSLMPQSNPFVAAASAPAAEAAPAAKDEALLLPELKQWDAAKEGIVLKPLPKGKRYFTDAASSKGSAEPSVPAKTPQARAHVVSFNTKEAAESALAGMAAKYPNAFLFGREAAREQVGGKWVWRGYFVGGKTELAALCKELSAANEWCHIR